MPFFRANVTGINGMGDKKGDGIKKVGGEKQKKCAHQ